MLSGFFYLTSRQITEATLMNDDVNAIRSDMSELRFMTFDYLLYKPERAKQQWQIKYKSLGQLLAPEEHLKHKYSEEEHAILDRMAENHKDLGSVFSQLTQAGISEELKTQLVSQLLIKSQDMISSASQLSDSANKRINDSQTRANYLNTVFLILLLVVSLLTVYIIFVAILRPLTKLHEGTEKIGQGNLDFKVGITAGDEIGQLSRSFDEMTGKLKESYAGLEEKVKEKTEELSRKVLDLEDSKKATMNLFEDIQEEKNKAEQARAKDEAMLASIGDGLAAVDKEGKILMVNNAFENLVGWTRKEVLGKLLVEVVPREDEAGNIVPFKERILTKILSTTTTKLFLVSKNKIKFPVAITVSPIILGDKIIGVVEVFRDITKEQAIDKAKTEFVSLASHQLRTPLGIIKWYLEALGNEDYFKKAPVVIQTYFDEINKSNERVLNLVRDLLSVSRIEQGRVKNEPKPVDLIALVTEIVKQMRIVADKKKITLRLNLQDPKIPAINIDILRLREVIENLIINALKYTEAADSVDVIVKKTGAILLISVKDTGIGISEADQKKLFTKFFRSEKAIGHNPEGSGLGLYVVKSYVEGWGGKVAVESAEGKGSTFTISLPISQKKNVMI